MRETRRIFVSYASQDRQAVEHLISALRRLRYEVWVDEALSGGQSWWDVILEQIRRCEIFVGCASQAMISSPACHLEIEYAARLRKLILPVAVEPVPPELLPRILAYLQVIPFVANDVDSAFELAAALQGLPSPNPVPNPLPAPPPVPISYLSGLSEHVRAPSLTADAQLALVARLEHAAGGAEVEIVLQLAQELLRRPDLYHSAARNIERLLQSGKTRPGPVPAGDDTWSVSALDGDPYSRTLELRRGVMSRTVRLQLPRSFLGGVKVFMDGERLLIRTRSNLSPVLRILFTIPVDPDEPLPCEMRLAWVNAIDGLTFGIQDRVLHREGTLAD